MRIVHLAAVVAGILTGAASLSEPARATPLAGALPAAATTAASPLVSDVRYYYGYRRPVFYRPYYRRRVVFYRRPVFYRPYYRPRVIVYRRPVYYRPYYRRAVFYRPRPVFYRPIWYRPRPIF